MEEINNSKFHPRVGSNRDPLPKEFTPIHRIRKSSNLVKEADIDIRKSMPNSYYKLFKMNSELQNKINNGMFQSGDDALFKTNSKKCKEMPSMLSLSIKSLRM